MWKKILCLFLGHRWKPYKDDFTDPYCVRCGEHTTIDQLLRAIVDKQK